MPWCAICSRCSTAADRGHDRRRERLLGVPGALIDLLRVQNGGLVANASDAFPTSDLWSQRASHLSQVACGRAR